MSQASLFLEYPQLFAPLPKIESDEDQTEISSIIEDEITYQNLQQRVDKTLDFLSSYLRKSTDDDPNQESNRDDSSVKSSLSKMKHAEIQATNPPEKRKLPARPPPPQPLCHGYHLCFDYDPGHIQRTNTFSGGITKTYYTNGAIKEVDRKGKSVISHRNVRYTSFPNGDKMQEFPDGANAYRYANGITELRLRDGTSIIEFPDGRRETRHKDGQVLVELRDGKKIEMQEAQFQRQFQ